QTPKAAGAADRQEGGGHNVVEPKQSGDHDICSRPSKSSPKSSEATSSQQQRRSKRQRKKKRDGMGGKHNFRDLCSTTPNKTEHPEPEFLVPPSASHLQLGFLKETTTGLVPSHQADGASFGIQVAAKRGDDAKPLKNGSEDADPCVHPSLGLGLEFSDIGIKASTCFFAKPGQSDSVQEKHGDSIAEVISRQKCASVEVDEGDSDPAVIAMSKSRTHETTTETQSSSTRNASEDTTTCNSALAAPRLLESNTSGPEQQSAPGDATKEGETTQVKELHETSLSAFLEELPPRTRSTSQHLSKKPAVTQQNKLAVEMKQKKSAPRSTLAARSAFQVNNVKETTVKRTAKPEHRRRVGEVRARETTHKNALSDSAKDQHDGEDGRKSNTAAAVTNLGVGADGIMGNGCINVLHFEQHSKGQSQPATPTRIKSGANKQESVLVDVSLDPDGLGKINFTAGASTRTSRRARRRRRDRLSLVKEVSSPHNSSQKGHAGEQQQSPKPSGPALRSADGNKQKTDLEFVSGGVTVTGCAGASAAIFHGDPSKSALLMLSRCDEGHHSSSE
ncbi:unnamed protein product, partial [Amoebophrya sp. A120]